MKKTLCFILILALAVVCGCTVWADNEPATLTIQAQQGQLSVGDTVSVNLYISAVKPIGKVTATVTYDTSVLTFVSGDGATGGDGVISIEQLNGLGTAASITLNFTAAAVGNAAVYVTNCAVYDAFEERFELQGKSAVVEISQAVQTTPSQTEMTVQTTPQTDANGVPTQGVLVDLQIDQGSLVPPFMYSIHDYSVTVPYEVDKVEIDGKTASLQDRIWYTGNPECVVGLNVRTITVTDIYGNQTVYTINITRLDQAQTTTAEQQPAVQTSASTESKADKQTTKKDAKDIKQTLMPALYIVLIVLVVALFIVIIWIKNKASNGKGKDARSDKKNERQRSKIKVSGSKNTKKKK